MKLSRIYIFLSAFIIISSCSKDAPIENLNAEQKENPADENEPESETEETESETETEPGNDTITAEDSFSLSYDGEEVIVTEWLGQRSENTIAING